jgi:hypothetical protein
MIGIWFENSFFGVINCSVLLMYGDPHKIKTYSYTANVINTITSLGGHFLVDF